MHLFIAGTNNDPANFREAMESQEKDNWISAILDEPKSMRENNVWKVVDNETDSMNNKINLIDSR